MKYEHARHTCVTVNLINKGFYLQMIKLSVFNGKLFCSMTVSIRDEHAQSAVFLVINSQYTSEIK